MINLGDMKFLKEMRNSKIPAHRLYYAKSAKMIINIGEEILKTNIDDNLKKDIENNINNLRKELENYEIYSI